jgi:hypothetical protein
VNAAAAADALAVAAAVPDSVAAVLAEAAPAEAVGVELPLADPAEFPQPARPAITALSLADQATDSLSGQ